MDCSIGGKEIIGYNLESIKWDSHLTLLAEINSKEMENLNVKLKS